MVGILLLFEERVVLSPYLHLRNILHEFPLKPGIERRSGSLVDNLGVCYGLSIL
jgi:hypothetical protein